MNFQNITKDQTFFASFFPVKLNYRTEGKKVLTMYFDNDLEIYAYNDNAIQIFRASCKDTVRTKFTCELKCIDQNIFEVVSITNREERFKVF